MVDSSDRVGVCPATVGLHRRPAGVRDPCRLCGMAFGHPNDGHRYGRHSARRRAPHQRPVHPITRDRLELGGRPGPPRADRLSTGCVRRVFTLGGVEEALDPAVRVGLAVDRHGTVHGVTSWLPIYGPGATIRGWTLDVMRRLPDGFRPV